MSEQPRGKRRTATPSDPQSTQIRVALIGLSGAVLTTLIGGFLLNWDKIVGRDAPAKDVPPPVVRSVDKAELTPEPQAVNAIAAAPETRGSASASALRNYLDSDRGDARLALALQVVVELGLGGRGSMSTSERLMEIVEDEGHHAERRALIIGIIRREQNAEAIAMLRAGL